MKERDPRTHAIIGAAMEVHRQLGAGLREGVYQDALRIELHERDIPFRSEVELPVFCKGRQLAKTDFICFDSVIVELKALKELTGVDQAQVINYLKATTLDIGLLINFGGRSLEFKRLVQTNGFRDNSRNDR